MGLCGGGGEGAPRPGGMAGLCVRDCPAQTSCRPPPTSPGPSRCRLSRASQGSEQAECRAAGLQLPPQGRVEVGQRCPLRSYPVSLSCGGAEGGPDGVDRPVKG